MSRILIALAALVILVAVAGVSYVAGRLTAPPTAQVAAVEPAEIVPLPAALPKAKPVAPVPAATMEAAPVTPSPSAVPAAPADLTHRANLEALLSALTPEQEAALKKAAHDRQKADFQANSKYTPPSISLLLSDRAFRLTDDQIEKIKAVRDNMKPQMDQALATQQAALADLGRRVAALDTMSQKDGEDLGRQLAKEQNAIMEKYLQALAPVEKQFQDQVRPLLSPDQQNQWDTALANQAKARAERIRRWSAVPAATPGN